MPRRPHNRAVLCCRPRWLVATRPRGDTFGDSGLVTGAVLLAALAVVVAVLLRHVRPAAAAESRLGAPEFPFPLKSHNAGTNPGHPLRTRIRSDAAHTRRIECSRLPATAGGSHTRCVPEVRTDAAGYADDPDPNYRRPGS